jgi:UDP-N-acetylglucosamine 4-epimerase
MSTEPLHILVTGGAGFIGSHVCEGLLADGHRVRCLDNFATGKRANVEPLSANPLFHVVEGDIRDLDTCRRAVEGVDAVVHLAALGSVPRSIADPLTSEAVNLTGFLHMLEACRHGGTKRIVYASSSSVYGDSPLLPKREDHTGAPLSPYAVTKAGDEAYARLYHHLFGLEPIGLRFFNVFGERQDPNGPYAAAIPRFILRLMAHQPPQVHGDGLQSRDFTYVANTVDAVRAALATTDGRCMGQVFNVAFGGRTTLLDLIGMLRDELAMLDPAVAAVGVDHVAERVGDVRDSQADISKARELLGFSPRMDLREGLRRAVPWYVRAWGGSGAAG